MHLFSSQAQPISSSSPSSPTSSLSLTTSSSSRSGSRMGSVLRTILIDVPLTLIFGLLISSMIIQQTYLGYVSTLIDSYRQGEQDDQDGFFPLFDNDFTYYNRQCDASDISTTDANDLLMHKHHTPKDAEDIMMTHGAIVFKNVLRQDTAAELREYLETRNNIADHLPWDEKFFDSEGRLSLGLGVDDHPIIGEALTQVGNHPELQKALESLVGPDPAIVEISTLTAMHGVEDQGIHTDSDYFGSSLLYSRNFLHSYTMFMSLQNTTAKMGPTTLCPGSHMCANEDLERVCLENGAFEASSNGCTGKDCGMLLRGDAMMFNQNVWHRGAYNDDPDFPGMNRAMFIVTFITKNDLRRGDYRYQGLGTYYYQRWNMWGHTFEDLKDPNTVMTQPFGLLRSLGLWKPAQAKFGITWLENFAREIANYDNFYDPYELPPFVDYLTLMGVPKFLHGKFSHTQKETDMNWEQFLKEMMRNVVIFLVKVNVVAIGAYLGLRYFARTVRLLIQSNKKEDNDKEDATTTTIKKEPWIPAFLKRIILTHGSLCILGHIVMHSVIETSDLAQHIKSGRVFTRPFPDPNSDAAIDMRGSTMDYLASLTPTKTGKEVVTTEEKEQEEYNNGIGPTTFPEKYDILIGTRFDTDFLGTYNHMLDYHPGNQRYDSILATFAASDILNVENQNTYALILRDVVKLLKQEVGLLGQKDEAIPSAPRFLHQDPSTGYWTIMSNEDAVEITRRAILMKQSRIVEGVGKYLKSTLADCRFGAMRDTIMCRKFNPMFVLKWEKILYGAPTAIAETDRSLAIWRLESVVGAPSRSKKTGGIRKLAFWDKTEENEIVLSTGDRVVSLFRRGTWLEAKILKVYSKETCLVKYVTGDYNVVHLKSMRKYEQYVEGDLVNVLIEDDNENDKNNHRRKKVFNKWKKARIDAIHPIGYFDLLMEDGSGEEYNFVRPQLIKKRYNDGETQKISLKMDYNTLRTFVEGEAILANYLDEGEWFDAYIKRVNPDGTFDVDYADGDKEQNVPRHLIRYRRPGK